MDESHVPQAGAIAPDFSVPDSAGAMQTLDALCKSGPLVLVFYRGHW